MKNTISLLSALAVSSVFGLSSCSMQEEKMAAPAKPAAPAMEAKAPPAEAKAAPAKAEAKAKPLKASGDVGLLDLEKNYLILVTKEGKLITADFSNQTKVTKLVPQKGKVSDIGLGQSATVTYTSKGDKKTAESVEYTVKAKKGE
jgi:hypothetical protein